MVANQIDMTMKPIPCILLILAALWWGPQLPAQTIGTNLEAACDEARQDDKQVLLFFTGSDWCKPCILFKRQIVATPEFKEFAGQELVLANLDFPAQRKNQLSPEQTRYNESLAERFNPKGKFPLVLLLSPDKEVLQEIAFTPGQSPADFIASISSTPTP